MGSFRVAPLSRAASARHRSRSLSLRSITAGAATARFSESRAAHASASLEEIYNRPGFLVKRCQQVAAALFDEECRAHAITPSQYQVMTALNDYAGIDQLALGRLTGQDRSTVSLVVRILIDRGLVRQATNVDDKRRKRLMLTRAGTTLLADLAPMARRAQERFLAVLPGAKRAEFMALLQLLVEGHGAWIDPGVVLSAKRAVNGAQVSQGEAPAARARRPRSTRRA